MARQRTAVSQPSVSPRRPLEWLIDHASRSPRTDHAQFSINPVHQASRSLGMELASEERTAVLQGVEVTIIQHGRAARPPAQSLDLEAVLVPVDVSKVELHVTGRIIGLTSSPPLLSQSATNAFQERRVAQECLEHDFVRAAHIPEVPLDRSSAQLLEDILNCIIGQGPPLRPAMKCHAVRWREASTQTQPHSMDASNGPVTQHTHTVGKRRTLLSSEIGMVTVVTAPVECSPRRLVIEREEVQQLLVEHVEHVNDPIRSRQWVVLTTEQGVRAGGSPCPAIVRSASTPRSPQPWTSTCAKCRIAVVKRRLVRPSPNRTHPRRSSHRRAPRARSTGDATPSPIERLQSARHGPTRVGRVTTHSTLSHQVPDWAAHGASAGAAGAASCQVQLLLGHILRRFSCGPWVRFRKG